MKGNIFTDIATAAKVTKQVRAARKAGADGISVKPVKALPIMKAVGCGFYDTVEGCAVGGVGSACSREGRKLAHEAFRTLDPETQRRFAFTPKDGEFVERAKIFADMLRPVLSQKDYHAAMIALLRWDRHIKVMRDEA